MKKEQFIREFLPTDITLKLYRDIPVSDFQVKIDLIKSSAETVRKTFDPRVYEVRLHNEIGHCYFMADKYPLAIMHFQKALEILEPQHNPFIYFNIVGLLIRSNRVIADFPESCRWIEVAFKNIHFADSSFHKLNILKDYVDVLKDRNQPFNNDYCKVIEEIIDDLGFPNGLYDPIDKVNSMKQTNHIWNRKLMEISLMDRTNVNSLIKAHEDYLQNCPIGWYKNYLKEEIVGIKNNIE
ncbi:tetratricopeptide repeat protein [Aquiflexum sp.]|uniref:tetratricopeptide repeat protein n=1 Tax=Aquiflexum sp. TaxID=1872584 RepID=UPI00359420E0